MKELSDKLHEIGKELNYKFGTDSYEIRCKLYDIAESLLEEPVDNLYLITFKYTNITDDSIHEEEIHAKDSFQAVINLHNKYNNIEWRTVTEITK